MEKGDYVRTKDGYIAKYLGILETYNMDGEYDSYYQFDDVIFSYDSDTVPTDINSDYFIKSSKKIIDLIEVGDYVNGHIVEDLDDYGYISLDDDTIKYDDIKSIVTKEMFKSMEYKI